MCHSFTLFTSIFPKLVVIVTGYEKIIFRGILAIASNVPVDILSFGAGIQMK